MTTDELRGKIEEYRDALEGKSGTVCKFSETGPVGMSVIDAVLETMETQQAKIDELEAKLVNRPE